MVKVSPPNSNYIETLNCAKFLPPSLEKFTLFHLRDEIYRNPWFFEIAEVFLNGFRDGISPDVVIGFKSRLFWMKTTYHRSKPKQI